MLMYSTFVTGLQEPVAQWTGCVRQVLDGAILYEGPQKEAMPCFFNSFAVLEYERQRSSVEQLMLKILRKPPSIKGRRGEDFRIVTSRENQLIAVDKQLRNNIEKLIAAKTGMIPERRGGGREFWFLTRSEGIALFMERQPSGKERKIKKGELRPQLAYCLNRLAQPGADDVMLDPFCGYGAITRARAEYFPCRAIHGLDIDGQKISALHPRKIYKRADIAELPSIFPAQSVDVIVTDPPWGLFKESDDIPQLYRALAKASLHLLKPGGRTVILSAQKELLRTGIEEGAWGNAGLDACYDILVSGQKAAVFVITRKG